MSNPKEVGNYSSYEQTDKLSSDGSLLQRDIDYTGRGDGKIYWRPIYEVIYYIYFIEYEI